MRPRCKKCGGLLRPEYGLGRYIDRCVSAVCVSCGERVYRFFEVQLLSKAALRVLERT